MITGDEMRKRDEQGERFAPATHTRAFAIGAAEARVGDLLGRRREKGSCYRACLSIWYVASKMVGLHQMIGLQGNQCAIARIDAHSNAGEYESRDNRWTCAQRPDVPAKRNQYHVRRSRHPTDPSIRRGI